MKLLPTDAFAVEAEGLSPLPLDSIEPGVTADCDVFADDVLLLRRGASISASIIDRLRSRGVSSILVSSNSRLLDAVAKSASPTLQDMLAAPQEVYRQHGVSLAVPIEVIETATRDIENAFLGLESGQPLDVTPMREIVGDLIRLFNQNPGGAIKLLDLENFDAYTYRHSLNVSMLFLVAAQMFPLSEDELSELVLGALLHDVGKMKVGLDIINKPDKLTDAEFALIKRHPEWGMEILAREGLPPGAREIVLHHHERIDGRGYPHGLKGQELHDYARLAAICDVYDALTTSRSYKPKLNFSSAIDILVQGSGAHFDSTLVHQFIKHVGRHPIGSFVSLSTGETAVVVRINEHSVSRPVVSVVLDSRGIEVVSAGELDLAHELGVTIMGVRAEVAK